MPPSTISHKSKDGRVWTRTKGHWPKGKARNLWGTDDWPDLRERTVRLLDGYPLVRVRSRHALAAILGTDHSTVSKWLRGLQTPTPSIRLPLRAWLRAQERAVERSRSK